MGFVPFQDNQYIQKPQPHHLQKLSEFDKWKHGVLVLILQVNSQDISLQTISYEMSNLHKELLQLQKDTKEVFPL